MSRFDTRFSDARRRAFLLGPGDTLVIAPNPIEVIDNFGRFLTATGVPAARLASSRLCALPVLDGSIQGVPGVRAETAWLPLFWLPPQLAAQTQYVIGDDGLAHSLATAGASGEAVHEEEGEVWLARVALELSASGLYDVATGTFLDVMDLVGIDIDTPAGLRRVRRWLAGAADDDLDLLAGGALVAESLRSTREPDWALNEVLANYEHLVHCAWATGAVSLFQTLLDLAADLSCGLVDLVGAKALVTTVCLSAATWLEDLAPEEWGGDARTGPERRWWLVRRELAEGFAGAPARFIEDHLSPAIRRLAAIGRFALPLARAYLADAGQHGGRAGVWAGLAAQAGDGRAGVAPPASSLHFRRAAGCTALAGRSETGALARRVPAVERGPGEFCPRGRGQGGEGDGDELRRTDDRTRSVGAARGVLRGHVRGGTRRRAARRRRSGGSRVGAGGGARAGGRSGQAAAWLRRRLAGVAVRAGVV